MLDIYLFSKNSKVLSFFQKIRDSRLFSVIIYNPDNYKTILKKTNQKTFVYLDISSFNDSQRTMAVSYITRQRRFDFGIIDPKNVLTDPAALFHYGASDYFGKEILKDKITVGRIKKALAFYSEEELDESSGEVSSLEDMSVILSGHNWDNIKIGNDYTFGMLHIEIDILPEWASKSGKAHLEEVMAFFYSHLNIIITPLNGRLWMKTEYGGLVLFPYYGSATPIIIECIKLVLNRIIFSAEEYTYNSSLSYKLVLDIGKTKYLAKGNTGNIISDSVNSIFHLGKQYASTGNFYLTDIIHKDIPSGLQDIFIPSESFEGRTIYRMKLPVLK